MKIAIVYDRINKWGGAEKVLLAIHEIFPEAPLFTSVFDPLKASWASVFPVIYSSYINKIPFLRDKHRFLAPLMPFAFESFNFDNYDIVISVTSEFSKGIITKPNTKHICYCLTPTRYLWSGYDIYFKGYPLRSIASPVVSYLRTYDKIIAQRPDVMIAISSEVKERIAKYYGRGSKVIFPPVDEKKFKIQKSKVKSEIQKSKLFSLLNLRSDTYYLIVSRLEPYKKVDLAIETFISLGYPLVVVGTGSQEKKYKVKYKSKKNIKILGFVDDEKLNQLYNNAKAFIMPQEEDFGIAAVEAQSVGLPVIAFNKGGARDIVIDKKTGILFENQNIECLSSAVLKINESNFIKNEIEKNAEKFSKQRFKKEILDIVKING